MVRGLKPVRVIAPAEPVVALADVKADLRVDHSDSDSVIQAQIDSATSQLDGYSGVLGRCLVSQTWRADFDGFPAGDLRLPFADVRSVSVAYSDAQGVDQTLSASAYRLAIDARSACLVLRSGYSWPDTENSRRDAVRVTAICGYGDADTVPDALREAIKLIVMGRYDGEDHAQTVAYLIEPYRLAPC